MQKGLTLFSGQSQYVESKGRWQRWDSILAHVPAVELPEKLADLERVQMIELLRRVDRLDRIATAVHCDECRSRRMLGSKEDARKGLRRGSRSGLALGILASRLDAPASGSSAAGDVGSHSDLMRNGTMLV